MSEVFDGEFALAELPPVTHFEELPPIWEIRSDESSLWYERFVSYLEMGPARTIAGAYKLYCEKKNIKQKSYPPQKWYKEAQESDWEARTKAYDQYLRALDRQADIEARVQARQVRRELINMVKAKLEAAIEKWEPDIDLMDWGTITDTLKVLLEQSRSEFGDTEPQKQLAVNVHANGARAFEDAVRQVYGE